MFNTDLKKELEDKLKEYKPVSIIRKDGRTNKTEHTDTRTLEGEKLRALKTLKKQTNELILEKAPLDKQLNNAEGVEDIKHTILKQYKEFKSQIKSSTSIEEAIKPKEYNLKVIEKAPKKETLPKDLVKDLELDRCLKVRDGRIDRLETQITVNAVKINKHTEQLETQIENLTIQLEKLDRSFKNYMLSQYKKPFWQKLKELFR